MPIYAADALVRRSRPLQATRDAQLAGVSMSPATMEHLGVEIGEPAEVRQGDGGVVLDVVADGRIPEGCAFLPAGIPATAVFGRGDGPVAIHKARSIHGAMSGENRS